MSIILWVLIDIQILCILFGIFIYGRRWDELSSDEPWTLAFITAMMLSGIGVWIFAIHAAYIGVNKLWRRNRVARLRSEHTQGMLITLYQLDLIDRDTFNQTDGNMYDIITKY